VQIGEISSLEETKEKDYKESWEISQDEETKIDAFVEVILAFTG
jgi:hypothetical protein